MFRQVADLTRLTAFLDMKHLNNVFLLPIMPCKPRLAKADVASHADKRGAADVILWRAQVTLPLVLQEAPRQEAPHGCQHHLWQ